MIKLPEFEDKKELFNYLVKNKLELIDLKKSVIKHADAFGGLVAESGLVSKASENNHDTEDTLFRTIVGNTYNWMDSHKDVHVNGIFAKTTKDRAGRIYHRHDHVPMLTAKVGKFSNVYEQVVNWTDLGVNKMGQTMSLLGDTAIKKAYNNLIFDAYKDGEIDQHSVGMQYVNAKLAVNDPAYKEEYSVWNKHIGTIGNQEKAIKEGFFFAVYEAKLIEISCVTDGSNELTGIYNPPNGSISIDPPASSQQSTKSIYSLFI